MEIQHSDINIESLYDLLAEKMFLYTKHLRIGDYYSVSAIKETMQKLMEEIRNIEQRANS